jgi:DNA-binding HxlR family transcriptional regulator
MTAALDLLGRRWALRILWELRRGPVRATELQARCDQMSTSVLYQRLRELTDAGLVSQDDTDAYVLTDLGLGLSESLIPLDDWARRWSRSAAARRLRASGG